MIKISQNGHDHSFSSPFFMVLSDDPMIDEYLKVGVLFAFVGD